MEYNVLEAEKHSAVRIARDLGYLREDSTMRERIQSASSSNEISRIMATARKRSILKEDNL